MRHLSSFTHRNDSLSSLLIKNKWYLLEHSLTQSALNTPIQFWLSGQPLPTLTQLLLTHEWYGFTVACNIETKALHREHCEDMHHMMKKRPCWCEQDQDESWFSNRRAFVFAMRRSDWSSIGHVNCQCSSPRLAWTSLFHHNNISTFRDRVHDLTHHYCCAHQTDCVALRSLMTFIILA